MSRNGALIPVPPKRADRRHTAPPLRPLTAAEQKLVEDNLGLAHVGAWRVATAVVWAQGAVARGLRRRVWQVCQELDGAAYEGLCIAAQRYDPSLGWKFSTYAVPWIKQKLGIASTGLYFRLNPQHRHRPSHRVHYLSEYFDPALWAGEEWKTSYECWDDRDPDPDTTGRVACLPLDPAVEAWLKRLLYPDDRYVLELYVLGDRSLETVARRLGVSKQRIQQRMARALGRLKNQPEFLECLLECAADKRMLPQRPPHGTAPERLA